MPLWLKLVCFLLGEIKKDWLGVSQHAVAPLFHGQLNLREHMWKLGMWDARHFCDATAYC